jgi:hypothetical protein
MKKLNALLFVCFAAVFASTVQAQTSGVNNAELNGNYTLNFNGFSVGAMGIASNRSVVCSVVGRFTADGAGNLTNGELDGNGLGPGTVFTQQPFTGTYTIGADNRGMMTLNIAGVAYQLAFAMTANGNAQFIEFDQPGGSIGSGSMEKADTTAFSTAKITGDYAFGLAGFDASSNRDAFVGHLTSDGAGNLTNETGDINARGFVGQSTFATSNYTVSDTTNGRGTMTLGFFFQGPGLYTFHFVFYIVNSGKLFVMQKDALMDTMPLFSGVMLQQQAPSGGFSNASLQGTMVIYLTGQSYCNGLNTSSDVIVGSLGADSNGALTLIFDENCGGNAASDNNLTGTYSVASNGRTSIVVGHGVIAYLVNQNQAFLMGNDGNVLFGFGEPQTGPPPGIQPLDNSWVSGGYAGLATNPATSGVTIFSGEFTADGATPTGHLNGTEDIGDATGTGLISGAPFMSTYSISSSPTTGRGSVTMVSRSGASGVAYVISSSKFVILPLNDPNPSVWLFEH